MVTLAITASCININYINWPNEARVGWLCCCLGTAWEPTRKRAHMQLIREHSTTVVSAHWATVDWSWPREWFSVCELISTLRKEKKSTCWEWLVEHSPQILASEKKATTTNETQNMMMSSEMLSFTLHATVTENLSAKKYYNSWILNALHWLFLIFFFYKFIFTSKVKDHTHLKLFCMMQPPWPVDCNVTVLKRNQTLSICTPDRLSVMLQCWKEIKHCLHSPLTSWLQCHRAEKKSDIVHMHPWPVVDWNVTVLKRNQTLLICTHDQLTEMSQYMYISN